MRKTYIIQLRKKEKSLQNDYLESQRLMRLRMSIELHTNNTVSASVPHTVGVVTI